jgi:fatty acid desaturase
MSITADALTITDPTGEKYDLARPTVRFALRFIHDARDIPFLHLTTLTSLTVIPFAALLFVRFHWGLAVVYWLYTLAVFLGPYILMLHCTSHRRLFRHEWAWMNHYIPRVLGMFFGQTPETYFAHHMGMHHPENNLPEDLSSTMRFQRDSFVDFMRYFLRFLTIGLYDLARYFKRKKRARLLRQAVAGEVTYYVIVGALALVNWRAALVVFIVPLVLTRFLMMAGNWAQHAFVDAEAPGNCYRNSLTCINSGYNRRCFNDGYHIGHHLVANLHWTELPVEFKQNLDAYAREGAIVFEGVDFFIVWFFLMLKRYDWLARCYVPLDGVERSRDEVIALLKRRTRRIATSPTVAATAAG